MYAYIYTYLCNTYLIVYLEQHRALTKSRPLLHTHACTSVRAHTSPSNTSSIVVSI